MSVGESGRIVVELPPSIKRELHAALICDGLTLKAWLISRAEDYLLKRKQISIFEDTTHRNSSATSESINGKKEINK